MANSKIIVVEGPQGAGKTTITDFLRLILPYSNLYRMSGTADSTVAGKKKAAAKTQDNKPAKTEQKPEENKKAA